MRGRPVALRSSPGRFVAGYTTMSVANIHLSSKISMACLLV